MILYLDKNNSMNKEIQFNRLFHLTSIVTDVFPNSGGKILDIIFGSLLGNTIISKTLDLSNKRKLKKINRFRKFLVVSDLNIGDAIIASCGVSTLKKIFPHSEIDFVIKKSAGSLVKGNPDISDLFAVYNGAPYPSDNDLSMLVKIADRKDYDMIINFSPMISDKIFNKKNVINYSSLASELVRNETSGNSLNNICYLTSNFIGNIFDNISAPDKNQDFKGANIYLSDEAIEKAEMFLSKYDVTADKPVIMFNPDASARFTRMPFNLQINLLKRFSDLDFTILLGSGHVEKFIEYKLLDKLYTVNGKKIIIVPYEIELDAYAALIDQSDIFITGDTGPLHIAAARKFSRSTGESLRNRTAVFSIFGSTPPRVYGYDSKTPGFFAANQDAPSRTFIANSKCRNITCINKVAKTCSEVLCFQPLDVDEIIFEALSYIATIQKQKDLAKITAQYEPDIFLTPVFDR